MRFAEPRMLWLLPVTVPLLAWFMVWAWRKKQSLIAQFVQSRLLAQLTVGVSPLRQKIRLALVVFAVACLLLALARPQWGFDWEEAKQRGLDLFVAVDTSRSMLAEDVRPNRLRRAQLAALDLMKLAKHDRLALIPFAGTAFLQCPLTLDEDAFRQSVEALTVGIIPVGGTAVTEAIEAVLAASKEQGDNYRILVLFTDGEDHDSGALEAAQKAARAGLRIFTVGVGTPNGELLRVTGEDGAPSYIKDDQGNVVKSRLDEPLLQQIATATGGFYLPLQGPDTMERLYEQGLASLPKSEISSRLVKRYHERFQWPLALALLALLAETLLPDRKRVPRVPAAVSAANPGLRKAVAALFLSASLAPAQAAAPKADAPDTTPEKRLREIRKQIDDYEQRLKRDPNDPRLHYNRGTLAYEADDYATAATELPQALHAPDLKLQQRAYYNLGNTLYRAGEHDPEVNQKIEKWEAAVQDFQAAHALDPQDADAKYNLEFVKKKLEELKKQQPRQDQKQQQQQDQQPPQKQDQPQDQKPPPDSSRQQQQPSKPDSKPPDQAPQPQDQQADAEQQKPKEAEQTKQGKPPESGKGGENSGEQSEANAAPAPGQMTVHQAEQLLDAQKGEERAMIFLPAQKLKEQKRVFKDW